MVLQGTIGVAPRYMMEAVAFGAIIMLVLYLLATNYDLGTALPILALYAFTGYRLMPAFQSIFSEPYGCTLQLAIGRAHCGRNGVLEKDELGIMGH